MPRERTTSDVFVLQCNYGYGYGWEDLAEYDDRREARDDLASYRDAEPFAGHRMITRRVRKEG